MSTASWRSFRGNPYVTIASITMGTIAASRTSCAGVPAFFQLSASAVTASGTSQPYQDLEYRWTVTAGAEVGEHTFSLSWLIPIVAGTTQSATRDTHVEQVGPEACFRFFTPGTKTVRLTARGSDGAGGYITSTTTIDLTVTAISAANHFWYDVDAGNNANDGKDPWGFNVTGGVLSGANVSAGLYEIVGKNSNDQLVVRIAAGDDRTLTKTGAFTSYNHTNATAPTDRLARYNYIGITSGTAANISTSNGPKQSVVVAASDSVSHFKGGTTATHTLPQCWAGTTRSNQRYLNYGTALAKGDDITCSPGSPGQYTNNGAWHGFNLTSTTPCVLLNTSVSGENSVTHFGLSNTTITPTGSSSNPINIQPNPDANSFLTGIYCWGVDIVEASGSGNGAFIGSVEWLSWIGGSVDGNGDNDILDHHLYPDARNHSVHKYINFSPTTGLGRNYCINFNCGDEGAGHYNDYHLVSECNLTGTKRAFDASNTNNNYGAERYRNLVVEANDFHGLSGDAVVLFYCCDSLTFRDNLWWNNGASGDGIIPDGGQTSLILKIYKNRFHQAGGTGYVIYLDAAIGSASTYPMVRDNVFYDTRGTNRVVLAASFANATLRGNGIRTPSNSGNVARDTSTGTDKTYAQYHAVDTTSQSVDPLWTANPAIGNFSNQPPDSLVLAPIAGGLRVTWNNTGSPLLNRLSHGLSSGPPYTNETDEFDPGLLGMLQRDITGLTPSTAYYVAMTQTNTYGWESAYCTEVAASAGSAHNNTRKRRMMFGG